MTYATVDELQERLDWTLSEGEQGVAAAALEDLTEWAQFYGKAWPATAVPNMVVRIVLSAAARHMRHFEGIDTSRAGDETVIFHKMPGTASTAEFSEKEIAALRKIARPGVTGLHSLQMTAYGSTAVVDDGFVPVVGSDKPFPYGSEPW